jgi:RNA 2',3'-cyclic 3'-phosphodiesterase
MRLFLAIEIPEAVKKSINEQLTKIRQEYRQFTWVPEDNYHITLHFFGEIADVDGLVEDLDRILFDVDSFRVYSAASSLFIQKKIVLYIELQKEKKMEFLVDSIKTHYTENQRQRYVPHLTIARYKIPSKQQYLLLKKKLSNLSIEFEFDVDTVALFESVAEVGKPVYKKLREFSLIHK